MLPPPVRRSVAAAAALLWCLGAPAPAVAQATDECDVTGEPGDGLDAVKTLYAERCPTLARRDCDPVDGRWRCSSAVIGTGAPGGSASMSVGTPSTRGAASPEAACTADAADLDAARTAFAAACPTRALIDCDPSGTGWRCSSDVLGAAAPGGRRDPATVAPTTPAPAPSPEPVREPAPGPTPPVTEPTPPAAPAASPASAPEPAPAPASEPEPEPAPETEPEPAATPFGSPVGVGRLRDGDLLALMYDNCPDRDDGHAGAAAKAVVSRTGTGTPWVVNGTCGDGIRNRFRPDSAALMDAVWGGGWVDAAGDRAGAVSASADAWAATLANGRDVWIAEGGPSDVTAGIVREMQRRYPSLDLSRLHVVQHSDWNEEHTAAANLDLVRRVTDYRKIDDGNRGGNDTAALNPSADFARIAERFAGIALGGPFATEWRAAFDYLPPGCPGRSESCKLDFSDAVELLWIVDDTEVRDALGFAERYLR